MQNGGPKCIHPRQKKTLRSTSFTTTHVTYDTYTCTGSPYIIAYRKNDICDPTSDILGLRNISTAGQPHSTKTAAYAPQPIVHFRKYTHAEGSGQPAPTWPPCHSRAGCRRALQPFCFLRWCPIRHPVARAKLCAGVCGMAVDTVLLGHPATPVPLRAGVRPCPACQPQPRKFGALGQRRREGQRPAAHTRMTHPSFCTHLGWVVVSTPC